MADLTPLTRIMARLRDPENGCPWDVAQDFASIAPYTIEEAYEVADAIEREDLAALKDELGDLLLQVVFHARMAEEAGLFAVHDVIAAICDKMTRRHPHIFAAQSVSDAETVVTNWEAIKAAERSDKEADNSHLAGVALALPALMRAQKIQKRAARIGFDWPDASGAEEKLLEELDEVRTASSDEERAEEIGDLLFAAVNLARHHRVDAEKALRDATAKFEKRFRHMETISAKPLEELDLDSLENLWRQAKLAGSSPSESSE